jgi:hypothetical protein
LITGDGKHPVTGDYHSKKSASYINPDYPMSDDAVFNDQGDVIVLVAVDGNRYTVKGKTFNKTFSTVDSDNQR